MDCEKLRISKIFESWIEIPQIKQFEFEKELAFSQLTWFDFRPILKPWFQPVLYRPYINLIENLTSVQISKSWNEPVKKRTRSSDRNGPGPNKFWKSRTEPDQDQENFENLGPD